MTAGCGACNLCCKLLAVPNIGKPSQTLCWWTTLHGGCSRQSEKSSAPELQACRQFECLYLQSQTHPNPQRRAARAMRPDLCHVVIGPQHPQDDQLMFVQVDPAFPSAWRELPVAPWIDEMIEAGVRLEIIIGNTRVELGKERNGAEGMHDGESPSVIPSIS